MDWQQSLQNFLDSNPDLPKGDDIAPKPEEKETASRVSLDILLERKGRAGKVATIVAGFGESATDDEIAELASKLKKTLGTGGSSRGDEILIQGDRRQEVKDFLESLGYKARII